MVLIGSTRCTRCGCDDTHIPDSCEPLAWCPRCRAACWHEHRPPTVWIAAPLEPFGRIAATALNHLNSWLGAAIGL